jgi:2-enoate reductase
MSCSVNPQVGKERYYSISRTERPKKVMVIGGGPGGMEAARVAALRGNKVTLFEKDKELGGQLKAASKPPFKHALGKLVKYLRTQLDELGVEIETSKEVTLEIVQRIHPDVVIVATGATPETPSITGIQNKKVISAVDLLLGKRKAGYEVIVLGASLVGCDTALYLAQEGKKVRVIKMRPGNVVAEDINPINRSALLEQLAHNRVTFLFDLTIREITAGGIVVNDRQGNRQTIIADSIVLALGSKLENKLVEQLKGEVSELYVVGDCISPRKVGEAMHEGFVAGWRI